MKIKQKVMRNKHSNHNSNISERYKTNKNTDSTPLLFRLRGAQTSTILNKQNDLHNINNDGKFNKTNQDKPFIKQMRIHSQISDRTQKTNQLIKSTCNYQQQKNNNQFNKPKFVTSSFNMQSTIENKKNNQNKKKQNFQKLAQSQEYFDFKHKQNQADYRYKSINFMGVQRPLTFGLINQSYLSKQNQTMRSSKQFIEQKNIKGHILDEIYGQQICKKSLVDSDQQCNLNMIACTNHAYKKAKYRLLVELNEGQDQMFYCSKCAINLLQQGFKIQTLSQQNSIHENNDTVDTKNKITVIEQCSKRVNQLQNQIKKSRDQFNTHEQGNKFEKSVNQIKRSYDRLIQILKTMKASDLKQIRNIYQSNSQIILSQQQSCNSILEKLQLMNKKLITNQKQFLLVSDFNEQIDILIENLTGYQQLPFEHNKNVKSYPTKSDVEIIQELENNSKNQLNYTKRHKSISKSTKNDHSQHYEMFLCDETQHPFRNLFPQENKVDDNSQYPTFGMYYV